MKIQILTSIAPCPSGWNELLGRCVFKSVDDDIVENWNAAKDKCKELHVGATLASIRDQADQDVFQGNYSFLDHCNWLYIVINFD